MTKPRRHIPGQIAMITRRCSERRYFLRPDDYINDVAPLEVGKAANKHGQKVYAAMAMSNVAIIVGGAGWGMRSSPLYAFSRVAGPATAFSSAP